MRNNLDSKFDAEWYLSVLQDNVINVAGNLKYWVWHPIHNWTLFIITFGTWWFFMLFWALIWMIFVSGELATYCLDVESSLKALDKDGGD